MCDCSITEGDEEVAVVSGCDHDTPTGPCKAPDAVRLFGEVKRGHEKSWAAAIRNHATEDLSRRWEYQKDGSSYVKEDKKLEEK